MKRTILGMAAALALAANCIAQTTTTTSTTTSASTTSTTTTTADGSFSDTSSKSSTAVNTADNKSFLITKEVQRIEGEVWFNLGWPLGGYHGGDAKLSTGMGVALRYNIKNTPFDAGVFFNLDCAYRDFYKEPGTSYNQNNRSLVFGVSGAYNFRQGSKVNPFAGIGLGVAHNDVVGSRHYPSNGYSFAFVPKIGVELLYHIRVNVYADINRRGYNMFGFSLGLVIGGRPRK